MTHCVDGVYETIVAEIGAAASHDIAGAEDGTLGGNAKRFCCWSAYRAHYSAESAA